MFMIPVNFSINILDNCFRQYFSYATDFMLCKTGIEGRTHPKCKLEHINYFRKESLY